MDKSVLLASMETLIEKTSTVLPEDVLQAIRSAYSMEAQGTIAHDTMAMILESTELSGASGLPICQDTGSIMAIIRSNPDESMFSIEYAIREAVKNQTARGLLRQNCVDPVSGVNTGDNLGTHVPQIHFVPAEGPTRISLMLKGGGSENVSAQYSLPHAELVAGRDIDGVRRCILEAAWRAQGKGCAPGVLGVCVGGDRASGYLIAKEMLFRRLDDENPCKILGKLEKTVMEQINALAIGPMGLGGRTTILGVKIGNAGRHPACFFVTISYSCWATRRSVIELDSNGGIARWLS